VFCDRELHELLAQHRRETRFRHTPPGNAHSTTCSRCRPSKIGRRKHFARQSRYSPASLVASGSWQIRRSPRPRLKLGSAVPSLNQLGGTTTPETGDKSPGDPCGIRRVELGERANNQLAWRPRTRRCTTTCRGQTRPARHGVVGRGRAHPGAPCDLGQGEALGPRSPIRSRAASVSARRRSPW
jgi:hypothetical protein